MTSEIRKFSPIADTGAEAQEEFDVDKFVEKGLNELSSEEADEVKYKEWREMGRDYLLTKALSEKIALRIKELDVDLSTAAKFGEMVESKYFDNPAQMPGWGELSSDQQEGIMKYAAAAQEQQTLLAEQKYILARENRLLQTLADRFDVSEEDATYKLETHNDASLDEEEVNGLHAILKAEIEDKNKSSEAKAA